MAFFVFKGRTMCENKIELSTEENRTTNLKKLLPPNAKAWRRLLVFLIVTLCIAGICIFVSLLLLSGILKTVFVDGSSDCCRKLEGIFAVLLCIVIGIMAIALPLFMLHVVDKDADHLCAKLDSVESVSRLYRETMFQVGSLLGVYITTASVLFGLALILFKSISMN